VGGWGEFNSSTRRRKDKNKVDGGRTEARKKNRELGERDKVL
jgi:hypothetical protein